jgi:very-short-patch-repair endonuclease
MRGGRPIKATARNLRANLTDAERVLWRELRQRQLGGRFRRQFPIPPYVVDFACIKARLIIEADGGQHNRPGEHEHRDARLQARGWRILRFWTNDILGNRDGVLQTIAEALKVHPHPDPPPQAGEGVPHSSPTSAQSPMPLAAFPISSSTKPPPPHAGEGRGGG